MFIRYAVLSCKTVPNIYIYIYYMFTSIIYSITYLQALEKYTWILTGTVFFSLRLHEEKPCPTQNCCGAYCKKCQRNSDFRLFVDLIFDEIIFAKKR